MDETTPDPKPSSPHQGSNFWLALAAVARDLRELREAVPQIRATLGDPEGRKQAVELLVRVGMQAGKAKLATVLRDAAEKLEALKKAQGGEGAP